MNTHEEDCTHCNGDNDDCFYCHGTGRVDVLDLDDDDDDDGNAQANEEDSYER